MKTKALALLAGLALVASVNAQVKISELPAASTLTGTELTLVVQGGVTSKSTTGAFGSLIYTSTATLTGKTIDGDDNTLQDIPITGLKNLATGGATFLQTPSSANLLAMLTTKTGTGNAVFAISPTLTTPNLGTSSALVLTNATGLPIATGLSGLGTGVATALAVNTGSAGAFVTFNGAAGTPSSLTLTNATGLPISTGVSGLAAGAATFLATPSFANLVTLTTGDDPAGLAAANAFTGANTFTQTAQGSTPTTGVTIQSTTAASNGSQENSPYLAIIGQGWKTNATAASQPVAILQNVQPVQGTSAPTGIYQVQSQIAGGGVTPLLNIITDSTSNGALFTTGRVSAFRFRGINRYELTNDQASYQWGVGVDFGNSASLVRTWGLSWSNGDNINGGSRTLWLGRDAATTAGWLQLGQDAPSTATTQTIAAHAVTTGQGADLVLRGGAGSTFPGRVRILGTNDGSAATAGDVGEATAAMVASGSAVALTTATGANVASITLTAGDWDVAGNVNVACSSATHTGSTAGFSTTSATPPTDGSEGYNGTQLTTASATLSVPVVLGRVSLTSTTTVYLTVKSTFSAGTAGAFGKIVARRRR